LDGEFTSQEENGRRESSGVVMLLNVNDLHDPFSFERKLSWGERVLNEGDGFLRS